MCMTHTEPVDFEIQLQTRQFALSVVYQNSVETTKLESRNRVETDPWTKMTERQFHQLKRPLLTCPSTGIVPYKTGVKQRLSRFKAESVENPPILYIAPSYNIDFFRNEFE